jgi:hypothetical protein
MIPWQFIMVALAGWMNRQQEEVIKYIREENQILRENLGHKRHLGRGPEKRPREPSGDTIPNIVTVWIGEHHAGGKKGHGSEPGYTLEADSVERSLASGR